jgi:YfiH family protein
MPPLTILRPKIFDSYPAVAAAFSTRVGGISPEPYGLNLSFNVGDDRVNVIRNRELFFGLLHIGLDELAIPMQCNVVNAKSPGGYENCDGLITREFGVFLTISVADCVPIFIYDPVQKAAAVFHAGWRGSADGIMKSGLEALETTFGSKPSDLIICIGPAAGVCCYEVGEEVAQRFPDHLVDRSGLKPRVDLKMANRDQLVTQGVPAESIEIWAECTIHESTLFHSHRRDGKAAGRMMGVMGIVR